MALFGAPVALEDHAFRGCVAALAIQEETNRLAAELQRRDGVALRLRVGLNSGRVIAGHHAIGDMQTAMHFMNAWASAAAGFAPGTMPGPASCSALLSRRRSSGLRFQS